MKLAIERRGWKGLVRKMAMFNGRNRGYRETYILAGGPFCRLCMDAPQVRLAGIGAYSYPVVDIAVRVAFAVICGTFLAGRSDILDLMIHLGNFALNGWTYGLICELAMLFVFRHPVLLAGRILMWVVCVRAVDGQLRGFAGDARARWDEFPDDPGKKGYVYYMGLARTRHGALQKTLRPAFGVLFAYLVFKPFFTQYGSHDVYFIIPTPQQAVLMMTAMAWAFLYRFGSFMAITPENPFRRHRLEKSAFWVRSILLPAPQVTQWPFWFPIWAGFYVLAGYLQEKYLGIPARSTREACLVFLQGMALIILFCIPWSFVFDWADGNCNAQWDYGRAGWEAYYRGKHDRLERKREKAVRRHSRRKHPGN